MQEIHTANQQQIRQPKKGQQIALMTQKPSTKNRGFSKGPRGSCGTEPTLFYFSLLRFSLSYWQGQGKRRQIDLKSVLILLLLFIVIILLFSKKEGMAPNS
jgi:hypothetical protein